MRERTIPSSCASPGPGMRLGEAPRAAMGRPTGMGALPKSGGATRWAGLPRRKMAKCAVSTCPGTSLPYSRSSSPGAKPRPYSMGGGHCPTWVFCSQTGGLLDPDNVRARVFARCLAQAGLRHMRMHDLRHTYASLLLQQGESLAISGISWGITAFK